MDRQVSKINKSDRRDDWWYAHELGRQSYLEGVGNNDYPSHYDEVSVKEWQQGWNEEYDRDIEQEIFYVDY